MQMRYAAAVQTDIGLRKSTNQDSALVVHAGYEDREIMLAVLCDGMGGLAKGELASATVVRAFNEWFDQELPREIDHLDLRMIGERWAKMLQNLNQAIYNYGLTIDVNLGTTVTALLMVDQEYVCVHVGDSRMYTLTDQGIQQNTTDQTFVAREIAAGRMTPEQAKVDRRRNMLLQCVGASARVEPQIILGRVIPATYLLCSDGFRHVISPQEIHTALRPGNQIDTQSMERNLRMLIERDKARNERDNITSILVYAGVRPASVQQPMMQDPVYTPER